MHLHKLKATNFRLLQDFEVEFFPDITVLIGPNNAGKSNIVDAIALTSQWMNESEAAAMGPRQWAAKIVSQHRLDDQIVLEFTIRHEDQSAFYQLTFSSRGLVADIARVENYEVRGARQNGNLRYEWGRGRENAGSFGLGSPLIPMKPREAALVTDFFKRIVAIDPFRQVVYQTNVTPKDMIASNGSDLASVLHYHLSNNRPRFIEFERAVQQVLPEIEFIGAPILGGPTTTVHLRFSDDPELYDLSQISSGLKSVLLLLTAIFYSASESLIIIEEPENHLHPASQKALSAVVAEAVSKNQKQFILTTHSENILNQFGVEKAIFISREGSRARATPLPEVEPFQVWERMGFEPTHVLHALGRAPQVLAILEGKGDYQALDPLWGHFAVKDKVLPVTSGGGGWQEIVDRARALREGLQRFRLGTDVFVLLDGNGDTAAKQAHLNSQGFAGDRGHVWTRKEVESYLLIPTALANISARPLAQVEAAIASAPGVAGKERLVRVLDALGIRETPNHVIMQNALANCLGEIPQELLEVPQKIRRMLGIR